VTMPSAHTFLNHLDQQLNEAPDRIVCYAVGYTHGQLSADPLSLSRLMAEAHVVEANLLDRGFPPGSYVLLAVGESHTFLRCFFGIMLAGLVPVPLPPLGETYTTKVFLERIKSVSMDCGAAAAIVSTPDAFNLDSLCLNIPVIASDEAWRKDLPLHNGATQDIAFIQYTSGSTARPRGVVVTHGNLLANCKAIANGCKFVVGDRAITWLPLYHDMGLVGSLLTAIYSNTPIYVMPPSLFMSRPLLGYGSCIHLKPR
jgi:acyl-CoA synthetase (AMP-forming)/AMP-acid ligase II